MLHIKKIRMKWHHYVLLFFLGGDGVAKRGTIGGEGTTLAITSLRLSTTSVIAALMA